ALESLLQSEHHLKDDAIILRGLIFLKQGHKQLALVQFQSIIDDYPTSDYHRLAVLTLKEIE
ncbi:MAG: hypothetical protein KAU50_07445, partial [Candidatus Marinimicrobia bacterium]|nr:hypothetical protein [Candidatus Neomarinimicrobiota bacterium]